MGIQPDLWLDEKGTYHLALYSLTRDTKKLFLKTLRNVKLPDGYSSNISRGVNEAQQKIFRLKSHDFHIMMEQLLPFSICNLLPNNVTTVLVELCSFFRVLSGKCLNLTQADLPYYGKLEDIIEINYYGRFKVILFKCKWADTTRDRGYKKDRWNFNCVNFERLIYNGDREEHDPYIEASQAQMTYYVYDLVNIGWSVVVHLKTRDLYEMGDKIEEEVYENEPYEEQHLDHLGNIHDEYDQLATNHLSNDSVE
ncbi:hypothetical protein KIW84_023934 [Lathyrus oleraceus]|uniref:DUF4216 domain-containing protein n=1 Tax=Pisum sativum TaxID=3888 RepID=A0A9D4YGQ2_PEA|nr:hypothetical protein KIW84_023934 [Pisum sativum]